MEILTKIGERWPCLVRPITFKRRSLWYVSFGLPALLILWNVAGFVIGFLSGEIVAETKVLWNWFEACVAARNLLFWKASGAIAFCALVLIWGVSSTFLLLTACRASVANGKARWALIKKTKDYNSPSFWLTVSGVLGALVLWVLSAASGFRLLYNAHLCEGGDGRSCIQAGSLAAEADKKDAAEYYFAHACSVAIVANECPECRSAFEDGLEACWRLALLVSPGETAPMPANGKAIDLTMMLGTVRNPADKNEPVAAIDERMNLVRAACPLKGSLSRVDHACQDAFHTCVIRRLWSDNYCETLASEMRTICDRQELDDNQMILCRRNRNLNRTGWDDLLQHGY